MSVPKTPLTSKRPADFLASDDGWKIRGVPPIGVLVKLFELYEAEEILALRDRLPTVAGAWMLVDESEIDVYDGDYQGVSASSHKEGFQRWWRLMDDDRSEPSVTVSFSARLDGGRQTFGPDGRPYEALAYDVVEWFATLEEAQAWCDAALVREGVRKFVGEPPAALLALAGNP
jgi:hypothetical protein